MRKLLNTLYILNENAYLSLDGENIVCRLEDKENFRIPFTNIEDIFCFSYLGCSPALMGKCASNGIPLTFISPHGKLLARVTGETKGNVYLRQAQFRLFDEPPIRLAQNTVAVKLANTAYVVRQALRDHPQLNEDSALTRCLSYLKNGVDLTYEASDIETIMGIEGNGAKSYFNIFERLILSKKEDFKITARTKRPPLDKVNAMLSFLYTIAVSGCASALESVGLDSYVGFYHALRPGRNSLACDMVEEFRCIVDRTVLTMINLRMINPDDFENQLSGAVYLNDAGRRKVLACWQEKKRTLILHPYLKQKIELGLLPYVQSTLLAKYVRGEIDEYPCFVMK